MEIDDVVDPTEPDPDKECIARMLLVMSTATQVVVPILTEILADADLTPSAKMVELGRFLQHLHHLDRLCAEHSETHVEYMLNDMAKSAARVVEYHRRRMRIDSLVYETIKAADATKQ